jgi:2-haloacid dehalogenase
MVYVDRRAILMSVSAASLAACAANGGEAQMLGSWPAPKDKSMSGLGNVRALVFDVFGTVVDWRTSVAREVEAMLRPRGFNIDGAAFATRWRAGYDPAMAKVRNGERPFVVLDQLHREMLEPVLAEFKVTGLSEEEKWTLTFAWRRLDPWPDTVEGLTRLKKRFVIAPLSNGNIALMLEMAKRAGLPWDAILGAETAQAYKPDPKVYDSAPRLIGVEASQVMMVAAHPSDLRAAAARGLKTAYVHRPNEYGIGSVRERPAAGSFDLMADSFVELAQQLGA